MKTTHKCLLMGGEQDGRVFEIEFDEDGPTRTLTLPLRNPFKLNDSDGERFITQQQYQLAVWYVGNDMICTYICNMTRADQFNKLIETYHESRQGAKVKIKHDIVDCGEDHHPRRLLAKKDDVLHVRKLLTVAAAHAGAPADYQFIIREGEFEEIKPT